MKPAGQTFQATASTDAISPPQPRDGAHSGVAGQVANGAAIITTTAKKKEPEADPDTEASKPAGAAEIEDRINRILRIVQGPSTKDTASAAKSGAKSGRGARRRSPPRRANATGGAESRASGRDRDRAKDGGVDAFDGVDGAGHRRGGKRGAKGSASGGGDGEEPTKVPSAQSNYLKNGWDEDIDACNWDDGWKNHRGGKRGGKGFGASEVDAGQSIKASAGQSSYHKNGWDGGADSSSWAERQSMKASAAQSGYYNKNGWDGDVDSRSWTERGANRWGGKRGGKGYDSGVGDSEDTSKVPSASSSYIKNGWDDDESRTWFEGGGSRQGGKRGGKGPGVSGGYAEDSAKATSALSRYGKNGWDGCADASGWDDGNRNQHWTQREWKEVDANGPEAQEPVKLPSALKSTSKTDDLTNGVANGKPAKAEKRREKKVMVMSLMSDSSGDEDDETIEAALPSGDSKNGISLSMNPHAPTFVPGGFGGAVVAESMPGSDYPASMVGSEFHGCVDAFHGCGDSFHGYGDSGWTYHNEYAWGAYGAISNGDNLKMEASAGAIAETARVEESNPLPEVMVGTRENEFIGLLCLAEIGDWVVLRENLPSCKPFFWHRVTGCKTREVPQIIQDMGIADSLERWSVDLPTTRTEPTLRLEPSYRRAQSRPPESTSGGYAGGEGRMRAASASPPGYNSSAWKSGAIKEAHGGASKNGYGYWKTSAAVRRSSWQPKNKTEGYEEDFQENGADVSNPQTSLRGGAGKSKRARSAALRGAKTWQPKHPPTGEAD